MAHFMHYVLDALTRNSSRPLFKQFTGTPESPAWKIVTYGTFLDDVERAASYWVRHLGVEVGLKPCDVVGVWVTGVSYTDLVSLYAIARAGYIPQMFNRKVSPQVIDDLLTATGGKALVYDAPFAQHAKNAHHSSLPIPEISTIATSADLPLPELPSVELTDMAVIFHTSGTTSGKPKPIPETHRFLKSQAQVQWPAIWKAEFKTQATFNNLGSFAAVGSGTTMSYMSWSGHCLIQTSKPDFDVKELLAMIKEGLNALFLYAPWLSKLITLARTDPVIFDALRGMAQIGYTGASLNPEDERWLMEHDMQVTAIYATTETALGFVSDLPGKDLPLMRLLPGLHSKLIPTSGLNKTDLDGDVGERFQGGQMYDLFIPADADNCPHSFVRNRPNGHITGDLFEEVKPGLYAFRGRNDDWIRTGKDFAFCDTKSIEDNVLLVCADIVHNCVVVGHYKPAIVLFIEPVKLVDSDVKESVALLKAQILERTAAFTERLFAHEKILDPAQIVLVAQGTLPRTFEKGNIRRKVVEDDNGPLLDSIYSKLNLG